MRVRSAAAQAPMASRSSAGSAATRERTGSSRSRLARNCSKARVITTKPGGTAMPARVSSPRLPPLPPTSGRSLRPISSNQPMIAPAPTGSDVELFVDRDAVLAAIGFVVVDEPPHVQRFDELAALIVELDRTLQPAEEFHALGMVTHECVNQPRRLVDEIARVRHPVIFEVPRAAFEAHHDDSAAVFVRADDAGLLDPQDVAEGVVAGIEGQVADRRLVAEGHPGALLPRGSDESARQAMSLDDFAIILGHIDDLVRRRRRSRDSGNVYGGHGSPLETVSAAYRRIVTTPRPPSTRMRWPSLIRDVALPVPTTA